MKLKRVIMVSFVATCIFVASALAAQISVEPVYQKVFHGDNVTVNITVDPQGSEVHGASYTLYFNNTLLKATSWTQGEFLTRDGNSSTVWVHEIDNIIGKFEYAESRVGTDVGGIGGAPGNLTTITFEAVREEGVSSLNINDLEGELLYSTNGSIPTTVYNGRVGIAQSPTQFLIRGYVSYKDGSDCNDPAVNITNLDIGKEWTAETNETSNYYHLMLASCADVIAGETLQFNALSPDESQSNVTEHIVTQAEVDAGGFEYDIILEFLPGDVNGDGMTTSADAAIALRMAVRGEYSERADVNGDYHVTSLDALMILQAAAGHIAFNK